jgi:Mrp family chromosome partitioning ATPase
MAMEKDRTVLLVDADVANPTVSRNFGLADSPGLLDVLEGDVDSIADVMVRTNLPRLRLLPAGRPRDNATELLASDRTQAIVDELQSRYPDRIVIFDSPPLLATSEALVLAKVVGQVAMVVSANTTPRMVVKEALSMLDPEQAVSLVLNKSQTMSGGKYGYYGSYGQYGQSERGGYDDNGM